ncbi:hypothetical protein ABZ362_28475 [Streptomyces sp. NPDC005951]|uniref:hypothetical protein n=1 Tax=Streptomyces sp. NPDC005951 TaxID=3154573 RepID=UPI0033CED2E9
MDGVLGGTEAFDAYGEGADAGALEGEAGEDGAGVCAVGSVRLRLRVVWVPSA